jgi:hypothetical protein
VQADALSVKVTTDRSIDCSTTSSIVADVCAGLATDREKAIALFDFVRRLMFHYPNRPSRRDVHDTLHLINTYGYSFCSQQALLTVHLWQEAGIKGGVWSVPGHATMQAEYHGAHRWFDALIGAYVFRRDGRGIASLQDIAEDPTLLTRAMAEKRACPAMVPCRTVLRDDAAAFSKHNPQYIRECADQIDDVTFMASSAPVAKPWQWGGPSPSRYEPRITLRRGEKVVYLWDTIPDQAYCTVLEPGDEPRAYCVTRDQLPPHHICGERAERRDPNYRFWHPYLKAIQGVRTGRYAANGRHTYHPDLSDGRTIADLAANTFVLPPDGDRRQPSVRVREAGKVSHLIVAVRTPHVYTGGVLQVEFQRATADDVGRISLLEPTRDEGEGVKLWDAADIKAPAGKVAATVRLEGAIRGLRDLQFKVECATSGDVNNAGINDLGIDTIFQHNMFARPYLVGGRNEVSVGADGSLEGRTFTLTYAWQEGDALRIHTETITTSPQAYTIDVAGADMPRMVSLEIGANYAP